MPTFELDFAAALEHPFPGLRAFEPAESFLFFGRERHTNELLHLLSTRRMLAIVGTSGSGKSSLVGAAAFGAVSRALGGGRIALANRGDAPR